MLSENDALVYRDGLLVTIPSREAWLSFACPKESHQRKRQPCRWDDPGDRLSVNGVQEHCAIDLDTVSIRVCFPHLSRLLRMCAIL